MFKANKLALAICAAFSSQAFALPAADFEGVCFYEHTDMLGQEFCYAAGAEIANVGSGANDKFSSFKTFGNAYAEIYEHTNYQGAKTTVMMNAYDMSFLEDQVSSLKIKLRKRKDFACVFEQALLHK
ncbi:MAG TPA: beta/gamma crystallin domain-containing protein [Agitococcus sp.]|nr:beta/gamma crystallin domain-containing protein [Agitococcus sp.]